MQMPIFCFFEISSHSGLLAKLILLVMYKPGQGHELVLPGLGATNCTSNPSNFFFFLILCAPDHKGDYTVDRPCGYISI